MFKCLDVYFQLDFVLNKGQIHDKNLLQFLLHETYSSKELFTNSLLIKVQIFTDK